MKNIKHGDSVEIIFTNDLLDCPKDLLLKIDGFVVRDETVEINGCSNILLSKPKLFWIVYKGLSFHFPYNAVEDYYGLIETREFTIRKTRFIKMILSEKNIKYKYHSFGAIR